MLHEATEDAAAYARLILRLAALPRLSSEAPEALEERLRDALGALYGSPASRAIVVATLIRDTRDENPGPVALLVDVTRRWLRDDVGLDEPGADGAAQRVGAGLARVLA